MAVVVFSESEFKGIYPEFASVTGARLSGFFDQAGLYLSNTDCSPVQDVNRRKALLYMLTAHIAKLSGVLNADGQPGPVGRVSQASQGTISASFEYQPGTGQWYAQTQYGAMFWQATLSLRSFKYFSRQTVY